LTATKPLSHRFAYAALPNHNTQLVWRPDETTELLEQSCILQLASGDSSGRFLYDPFRLFNIARLLIWDVAAGALLADCSDPDKRFKSCRQIGELAWLPYQVIPFVCCRSCAHLLYIILLLEWCKRWHLTRQGPGTNYLLALHVPSLLVLWHADRGTALWKVRKSQSKLTCAV
jgi:hypothetical protein